MNILDPYTIPLESINLIEASAGTGKSWTVTYLYLRLLLEKNLTVDQILVVTFTDAATKELRDDIRQRIVAALNAFETIVNKADSTNELSIDIEYQKLIEKSLDHNESIRKLNRAKLSMDEAAVFTIHSFCQRCLTENAFEASLPFESELLADDSEIMQKLTDDFWRRYTEDAPKSLLFKLHQKSITPDSLLRDVKNTIGKPYLEICGPKSADINAEKWSNLESLYLEALNLWQTDNDQIIQLLTNPDFEKHYYKGLIDNIDKLVSEIETLAKFDKLPYQLDTKKMKWLGTEPKLKKAAKIDPIDHPFFQAWQGFLDLWTELDASSDDSLNNTRIELIHHLQAELPKEKQRLGVLSFDDLLLQLQQTLKNNDDLAKALHDKYKAALIDEFQDTDPIQYDIFHTIYNDSQTKTNAVYFVGDPKQAIYSFRGGDIHTYLNAKANTQAQNQYTLEKNWRSHPSLIMAFNTLYAISDNPFKDEDINYVGVTVGNKTNQILVNSTARSALNFWQYEFDDEKKSIAKIRQEIAESIAGDIAQTLNDGLVGKAKIGDKNISGGDIAILIRSHAQSDIIKTALNARGISSVQNSRDSIYETHEANELIYVLKAILNPQQEDRVRCALVTEFMGYKGTDLIEFQNDNTAWETILIAMQNWHQLWKKQGFLPMMRSLMKSENSHQHLLSFADGERRISNVLQLSELIHQSARNNMLGMTETLRWLQKQQLSVNSNETELRLESDEDLVKIVTIHKSKGLEYPIVYCPYIGMGGKAFSDSIFTFNEDECAKLEIGSTENADHKAIKKNQESAEDSRLLYVALTRAKYQCNVVCFNEAISGNPDRSALGWLLSNGLTIPSGSSAADKKAKAEFFETYQQNLQNLSTSDASISVEVLPENPSNLLFNNIIEQQKLSAREFKASIKQQAQITSFSGLTAGAHDEAPDYDAIADYSLQNKSQLAPATEDEFPRGAAAGTALHEIFEHIDFVVPVSEQLDIIKATLNKYGFDEKHQTSAVQLIQQSLDVRLQTPQNVFSLKDLTKSKRLDEMEFYLPLSRLHINDLRQILFKHLPKDHSPNQSNWQMIRDAVDGLYFEEVEGFLKGFIDLIFEHDGKYYLADYKSNTLNNYDEEGLFEAMAHSHYYLQYLFYSVALHRYLKQRIADYSWKTHIGGAYYLFIRGMISNGQNVESAEPSDSETTLERSDDDPKGEMQSSHKSGGVFFDKPSIQLIEALDNLFVNMKIAV